MSWRDLFRRGFAWRWAMYLFLALAVSFFLMPVYMMLVTALKEPIAINLDTAWQPPRTWN